MAAMYVGNRYKMEPQEHVSLRQEQSKKMGIMGFPSSPSHSTRHGVCYCRQLRPALVTLEHNWVLFSAPPFVQRLSALIMHMGGTGDWLFGSMVV